MNLRAASSLAVCLTMMMGDVVAQTVGYVQSINECLRDNIDYPVSRQIKIMYCTCMVDKMSDSETRSVAQWEKVNPLERDGCARRAGWN